MVNYKQANQLWIKEYYGDKYNCLRAYNEDFIETKEGWAEFIDFLCKEGYISQKDYDTWNMPSKEDIYKNY